MPLATSTFPDRLWIITYTRAMFSIRGVVLLATTSLTKAIEVAIKEKTKDLKANNMKLQIDFDKKVTCITIGNIQIISTFFAN